MGRQGRQWGDEGDSGKTRESVGIRGRQWGDKGDSGETRETVGRRGRQWGDEGDSEETRETVVHLERSMDRHKWSTRRGRGEIVLRAWLIQPEFPGAQGSKKGDLISLGWVAGFPSAYCGDPAASMPANPKPSDLNPRL